MSSTRSIKATLMLPSVKSGAGAWRRGTGLSKAAESLLPPYCCIGTMKARGATNFRHVSTSCILILPFPHRTNPAHQRCREHSQQ